MTLFQLYSDNENDQDLFFNIWPSSVLYLKVWRFMMNHEKKDRIQDQKEFLLPHFLEDTM